MFAALTVLGLLLRMPAGALRNDTIHGVPTPGDTIRGGTARDDSIGLFRGDTVAKEAMVCVLTPRVHLRGVAVPAATVALPSPTLLAIGSFEEVRIERGGSLLWQRQASRDGPIEGPLPWPLAPLRPGETVLLRLRPVGQAGDGHFATISITAGERSEMERATLLIRDLGHDPERWLRAVRAHLDGGDLSLALALLFHFDGPGSEELDALRREVYRRGCSETR
jgi:hypothetical protein